MSLHNFGVVVDSNVTVGRPSDVFNDVFGDVNRPPHCRRSGIVVKKLFCPEFTNFPNKLGCLSLSSLCSLD
jgi:hypothetical protein